MSSPVFNTCSGTIAALIRWNLDDRGRKGYARSLDVPESTIRYREKLRKLRRPIQCGVCGFPGHNRRAHG